MPPETFPLVELAVYVYIFYTDLLEDHLILPFFLTSSYRLILIDRLISISRSSLFSSGRRLWS